MPWDFVGANCWGIDTEFFFPEKNILTDENRQARKICASCIVKQDCLTYALHYEVQGIWSGTTARERKRMSVKLGIKPKPITNERHKL